MKNLLKVINSLLLIGILVSLNSCKKDDTPPPPDINTYTVKYTVFCTGAPLSQYPVSYIKNGTTYTHIVTIPSGTTLIQWDDSYYGTTGDNVSVSCTPPYASGFSQYVSLKIEYNAMTLVMANANYPNTANASGTLP